MVFTFKKLRDKLEEAKYDNALNDCLVLLKNNGMGNYEAQNYILERWSDIPKKQIKLYGNSSIDVIIEHIKREVK